MINHNPPIPRTTPENNGLRALSEALAPLRKETWMEQAMCAAIGPSFSLLLRNEQQIICAVCPVRVECVEYAIADPAFKYASRENQDLPLIGGKTYREVRLAIDRGMDIKALVA